MNRILLASIAIFVLAGGGVAAAADLDVKAPERRCGDGVFQGIYVGANGGGVNYTANRSDLDAFLGAGIFTAPATYVTDTDSGILGGQIGYNFQCRNAVFGVEIDGDWTQVTGTVRLFPNAGPPLSTVTSRLDALATARLRAGVVAADTFLLYATGGLAASRTQTTWSVSFPGVGPGFVDAATFNETNWGWVAGFGGEWALTERLSLRSEVLYANFPDRQLTFDSLFVGGPVTVTHSDSVWVARVGADFRLTKD